MEFGLSFPETIFRTVQGQSAKWVATAAFIIHDFIYVMVFAGYPVLRPTMAVEELGGQKSTGTQDGFECRVRLRGGSLTERNSN
jgi:hypothetical protein